MSFDDDITDTDRMDWLQSTLFSDIDIRLKIDAEINSKPMPRDQELMHLAKGTC